jgi:hypothetical protein
MGLFGGSDPEEEKKEDIELDKKKVEDRNINRLVKKAEGDTVTKDILTECAPKSLDKVERLANSDIFEEDYFVEENPIINYLSESENPQFIFHAKVDSTGTSGQILTPSARRNGEQIFEKQYNTDGGLVVCFTDESILLIRDAIPPETTGLFSTSQPDYTINIAYNETEKLDFEYSQYNSTTGNGFPYHKLKLELEDGTDYEIKIPRQYSDGEIYSLIEYLSSKINSIEQESQNTELDNREMDDKNINKLVKKAEGDTVTKDILTECAPESLNKIERYEYDDILEENYFVEKNPIIHYLSDSENPQFIFHAKVSHTSSGEIYTCQAKRDGERIFDKQYKTNGGLVLCFTDESILLIRDAILPEITGHSVKSQSDYTINIPYNKIEYFGFEWTDAGIIIHKLKIELKNGTDYEIGIPRKYSNSELNGLITYLSSKIEISDAQMEQKPTVNNSNKSKKTGVNDSKSRFNKILYTLRSMNPLEFEKVVANLWESQGWNVQLTSQSSDRGADVVATKEDALESRRILIQAKKYGNKTKVSSKEMQQYAGLYARDEQVDSVFVVTSNEFTSEARKVAKNRKVEIINAKKLIELIREHNVNI